MNSLESSNLLYREITFDDTEMVLEWRNSDFVRANFIHQSLITREEHLKWLEQRVYTGEVIQFIMIEKDTNKPIGSVYLRDIDDVAKKAEYGIFIGEERARGKGYGTETAKKMLQFAFGELKLHKLSLRVLEENFQAVQSYKKAGFHLEARLVDELFLDKKYRTLLFMAAFSENN